MNRSSVRLFALAAMAGAASGAMAQTDALYLVDAFSSGNMYVAQGGSVINSWGLYTGAGVESPVAVAGTVRTMGSNDGGTGAEYTLGGTWTGTTYTNPLTAGGYYYDGTTDGSRNYTVDYLSGTVYAGAADWTGMAPLFSTGRSFDSLGIAYDMVNGTLWISNYSSGSIEEFTMGGSLVTSFSSTLGGGNTSALAYEPSSDTLWVHDYLDSSVLQFSKTGTLMATLPISGLPGNNILAMEFAVPAPGSLALVGLGGLAAARRRRD